MRSTRMFATLGLVAAGGMVLAACGNSLDAGGAASSAAGAVSSAAGAASSAAGAVSSAASAASSAAGGGAATDTIKVGFVSPFTGPLAAFGEGDQWVIDQMTAWFAANPIQAGGKSYNVQIITKDSQSDPKRAGEVAADLINTEGVQVLMAHATPETTVPVSQQCEQNQVLCITTDTPWQPWVVGMGGNPGDPSKSFKYAYHFFFGAEDIGQTFVDIWNQVDTNKKVGAFYANDADGQAFTDEKLGLPPAVAAAGYTWDNPGLYPVGTQDFSAQINAYKSNDDQILDGIAAPPDFATMYTQAKQQGYNPKVVTVGKATEFPAAIEALGDLGEGLCVEVWWAPSYPTTSSLTGLSSQAFADSYTKDTGKQWNMPLAYSESLFEAMNAAVIAAGGPDTAKMAEAMKTLNVKALVGDLAWGSGPHPNIAHTVTTGGQWRKTDGGQFPFDLVIVSNKLFPAVPLGGKVEPLK